MITLHFTFLGYEVATLRLSVDFGPSDMPTPVDRGVKRISRWWVERGMK
jgi:hypothetical protein